jgi:predicted ATPase
MTHLRSVALGRVRDEERQHFAFTVPVVGALTSLEPASAVTFLVDENGSGKSARLSGCDDLQVPPRSVAGIATS